MRFAWLLLAAAVPSAAAPAPVASQPTVSPASRALPPAAFTTGPVRADARRLAEQIMPEDLFLSFVERSVESGIDHAKGEFADLDREHPGILDVLRVELAKVGRAHAKEQLPQSYDRYGRAFASHFTPEGIAQLSEFYASRIGQKFIVGKYAGLDLTPLLQKWTKNPEAEVTEGDVAALNRTAVGKIFERLDRDDFAAMIAFTKTPAFAKLRAFMPTMTALEAQISSEPDPSLDAKMEKAVLEVMTRYGMGAETS